VLNNPLGFGDPLGLLCVKSDDPNTELLDEDGNTITSKQGCADNGGQWVDLQQTVTVNADPLPSCQYDVEGCGESPTWVGIKSFFTNFTVFGSSGDPRPSCFAGFLKNTVGNFFGYSGADVAGGAATAKYIATPPSPVPPTMALRGGKFAANWIKADEVARVRGAAKFGLAVNLVLAEAQALASEVNSASNGNCK
jgi:hypothetical protein